MTSVTAHGRLALVWALCTAPPLWALDPPATDRAADWREDLRMLAEELPRRHKNAFHEITRETWEASVAALDKELPTLTDQQALVRFMALVASIGDAHTFVEAQNRFRRFPLAFRAFSDGVFVVGASPEHEWAIGWSLISIDGTPFEAARDAVAATVSHENPTQTRDGALRMLVTPEVLHATGITRAPDDVTYALERDGERRELTVHAAATDATGQLVSRPAPDAPDLPLYMTDRNKAYWWRLADGDSLLYIAYNRCAEDPDRPFAEFAEELAVVMNSSKPARVVIDLRNNGGGNSMILAPLIEMLRRDARINQRGRLYVLIGPRTHSSAMMNSLQLRNATRALLAGEPTGGRPNSYGEIVYMTLPRSQLRIGYSTKYFRQIRDADPLSVMPDMTVELSSADYFAGRDPVLDAVRSHEP